MSDNTLPEKTIIANEGILLESGTNEVESLEFVLNGQHFGVNVLKIPAIETAVDGVKSSSSTWKKSSPV